MIDLENLDKYQVRDERYKLISIGEDPRQDNGYIATYLHDECKFPVVRSLDPEGVSPEAEFDIIEKPVIKYVNLTKYTGARDFYVYETHEAAISDTENHAYDYYAVAVPVQVGLNLDKIRGKQ